MYIRPKGNDQGGYELLNLQTNKVINISCVTPTPINKSVMRQVHALAAKNRMPQGLKIVNRADITLCDSSWTAGVDYEEEDAQCDD